jgi:hypothetical protein
MFIYTISLDFTIVNSRPLVEVGASWVISYNKDNVTKLTRYEPTSFNNVSVYTSNKIYTFLFIFLDIETKKIKCYPSPTFKGMEMDSINKLKKTYPRKE